jgi:hypothetical protein
MGNAPDAVKRLVDRFDQDREVFQSGEYKEEQLRAEFLNPFFTALGWDMDNKQGLSGFSVIANSVHGSWSIVPGTEDRKPGTKNRELGTNEVIRLTAGHQAKVEEKPEVRKAGGVYYTPTYIVKNAVGGPREGDQPARLTSARRRSKMEPVSAQGRPALTDTDLFIISQGFPGAKY